MSKNTKTIVDEKIEYIKRLIKEGKPEFAQFESAKLVAQYPDNVMALCLMTYIFYIINDPKNALRYAKLTYAKTTPESTWNEIVSASNAQLLVGEIEEAHSVLRHLDLEKITNINDLSYIAKHYGSLDLVEMAAKIFDRISEEQLDFHSRQMYGVAKLYLGQFSEARIEFEKAIQLNPLDGVSYNQLSVLKVAEKRSERIAMMEAALKDPKLDPVSRSYIHFSLFNELDANKAYGPAWEHLQKANQVRRATIHHDARHDVDGSRNIIAAYKQSPSNPFKAQDETVPIFIVGLPRTGTTLLEKILSSFDEVKPCGELRAFRRELELATNSNFITPFGLGFQNNIRNLDYEHIGREYLRKNRWRHEGKKFFTDKEPSNYVYAGIIARALPNARILHIRRNPMDACLSNYKQFFGPSSFTYSYDLSELVEHYKIYEQMMQFWSTQVPDSILEIRYENLVDDPVGQAERIRLFCGLEDNRDSKPENNGYVTSTLSAAQVRAPIHKGNVNSWQKYQQQLQPVYDALQEYIASYEKTLGTKLDH